MPPNSALTVTELSRLLLVDQVDANLSYLPDDVRATATVATTPTYPCLTIAISGASAGWIDTLHTDRTCKIVSGSGVLRGYYRMRLAPDSGHVYIAEITGDADGGLFADAARTQSITSSDIISVLGRRDIDHRKTYIDSSGIIYQDGSTTVGDSNTYPEPIVNMTINGEAGDYGVYTSSGTVHMTCVAIVTKWPPSGGSTLTYAWIPPSAATNITGNLTATCEFDLPAGAAYEINVHVTDSIGHDTFASRVAWLHNSSYLPVAIKIPEGDERDRSGRKCKVIGPQAILGAIPPGAKVLIWGANDWGGNDVTSATKKFSGYMMTRPYSIAPGYFESQADIVGPMGVLARTEGYGVTLRYTGSMTTWNELASSVSTVQFVTWWILRWRAANVLRCFDFTPLNTSNLTGRRRDFTIGPGKVAQQLQTLAKRADSNIGARSDGGFIHAMLPWIDSTSTVTRDTLDYSIYQSVNVQYEPVTEIKPIEIAGYYSNLTADVALTALAPGDAPESPTKLNDKIYESLTDAQVKAGREYARGNSPYKKLTVYIPVNRDAYEPVDMQFVPVIVPAAKSPTGAQITLTGIPDKVAKVWLGGKRAALRMDLDVFTDGKAGLANLTQPQVTTPSTYNQAPAIIAANKGWGSPSNWVFDRIQIFTDGGQVAGLSGARSTPSAVTQVDLSPTDYASLAGGAWMVADPFAYKTLVSAWTNEIRSLPNFSSAGPNPTWTSKYIPNLAGNRTIRYEIAGSINWNGYWAWLEYNSSTGDYYYCYTFNNYGAVSYTNIGGHGGDSYPQFALWPFSTNSNGVVYLQINGLGYKSTTWGASFSLYPNANYSGYQSGGINVPYSLRGGGEASSLEYFWTEAGFGFPFGPSYTNTFYGSDSWTGTLQHHNASANTWGFKGMNSYTLDGNYLNFSLRGQTVYSSDDAGHTWTPCPVFGGVPVINGCPTNRNYIVGASGSHVYYTKDRGVSDIQDVPTSFGSIIQVFGDLTEIIDESGVHP